MFCGWGEPVTFVVYILCTPSIGFHSSPNFVSIAGLSAKKQCKNTSLFQSSTISGPSIKDGIVVCLSLSAKVARRPHGRPTAGPRLDIEESENALWAGEVVCGRVGGATQRRTWRFPRAPHPPHAAGTKPSIHCSGVTGGPNDDEAEGGPRTAALFAPSAAEGSDVAVLRRAGAVGEGGGRGQTGVFGNPLSGGWVTLSVRVGCK